jgi:hypothetical protein
MTSEVIGTRHPGDGAQQFADRGGDASALGGGVVRRARRVDEGVGRRRITGIAGLDGIDKRSHLVDDLVVDRLLQEHPRWQSAPVTGKAPKGDGRVECACGLEVRVFQNDVG